MRAGAFGTLVSALAILSLQAGDFSKTCTDISVSGAGVLGAVCRTRNNDPHITSINLNERIANIDGNLRIMGGRGDFARSCDNLKLEGRSVLRAHCRRIDGQFNNGASIELDKYIQNLNGELKWEITRSPLVHEVLHKYVEKAMESEGSSLFSGGEEEEEEQPAAAALHDSSSIIINEVVALTE